MTKSDITNLLKEAKQAAASLRSEKDLERARVAYVGRKGKLAKLTKQLKDLTPAKKRELGPLINDAKAKLEALFNKAGDAFAAGAFSLDPTLPGKAPVQGHIHPLTQLRLEVIQIFSRMGFDVLEGPELETDYYNFEALNIPPEHPARDIQDTFFIDNKKNLVMRTHTSNMQVRYMESNEPPFRAIIPGRVFRNENTDASHEHTFYQVEGFVVDRDITVGHLIGTLKTFLSELFGVTLEVRLRPTYFPFVEPGFEMDFSCVHCHGTGCRVCKQTGWVELLGCGMIHPNVLKSADLAGKGFTGFAFGMGLDRVAMMKYNIDDIRYFQSGDLQFLNQF